MIKVVNVTYFDSVCHMEIKKNAVLLKDNPKTMKFHCRNNELFSHKCTIKKENIVNVSELEKTEAIDFLNSCSDLKFYVKSL